MRLHDLPDLALHQIFLDCDAEDIVSLRKTNQKLFNIITANRLHYSKIYVPGLFVFMKQGERFASLVNNSTKRNKVSNGMLNYEISSFNPEHFYSFDHDELVNMNILWWRERRKISLYNVVDYRRYLAYFDRCTYIHLECDLPKSLGEILKFMETKNLQYFSLKGNGELKCTRDDLLKIGRLSNKLVHLELLNLSESSNIFIDDVLDMIEIGCFATGPFLHVSRLEGIGNIEQCLMERSWVSSRRKYDSMVRIRRTDDLLFWIQWKHKH